MKVYDNKNSKVQKLHLPKIDWFYYKRQDRKLESKLELIVPKAQNSSSPKRPRSCKHYSQRTSKKRKKNWQQTSQPDFASNIVTQKWKRPDVRGAIQRFLEHIDSDETSWFRASYYTSHESYGCPLSSDIW